MVVRVVRGMAIVKPTSYRTREDAASNVSGEWREDVEEVTEEERDCLRPCSVAVVVVASVVVVPDGNVLMVAAMVVAVKMATLRGR
ncbi:hypothetical protein BC829DRAFT_491826 [Chytridium lagenaria]|nr:hypothetical protein BC829DRAFT_491826 [Chytridium lagenaria]